MFLRECNWLHGMEGDIDSAHLAFLHHGGHTADQVEDFVARWLITGRAVENKAVDTVWGTMEGHRRPDSCAPDYWHYTQCLLPSWTIPGQSTFATEEPIVRFWLPMDDTHAMIFQLSRPRALVNGKSAFLSKLGKLPGVVVTMSDLLRPNSKDWYGRWRLTPSEENDYFLDRESQQDGNYIGIAGIQIQDKAVTESMGPVVDHDREHLCATDVMISRTRHRLLKAVEAYAASLALPRTVDEPGLARAVRAGGDHLPPGVDWIDFYREKLREAGHVPIVLADDPPAVNGGRAGEGATR
jgi:phthalate 4,5-dioxygenase oxygenase subunit